METKTENKSKQPLLPWDPLVLSYGWWKQSDGDGKLQIQTAPHSLGLKKIAWKWIFWSFLEAVWIAFFDNSILCFYNL